MENGQKQQQSSSASKIHQIPAEHGSISTTSETPEYTPSVSRYQKIYNAFGFQKAYNFPLCKLRYTP
jgi:hypothetical protein